MGRAGKGAAAEAYLYWGRTGSGCGGGGGYFIRYFFGSEGRTLTQPVFPWVYRTFKGEGTGAPHSLRLIRRIDSKKKKKMLEMH